MPFQKDAMAIAATACLLSILLQAGVDGRLIGLILFFLAVAYLGTAAIMLLALKPPKKPKTDKKPPPDAP